MNARLYDPWLGRFLAPDPIVIAPTYSQNFNRYSYALNNPPKFTDPSGEFPFLALGLFVGITYLSNAYNNRDTETGKWAWNPVDWYSSGGNSSFVAGVTMNANGTNVTGYAGIGSNSFTPSFAYNNNQGIGVGVASPAYGGSGFYYPNYNYSAPEANAASAVAYAANQGNRDRLFDNAVMQLERNDQAGGRDVYIQNNSEYVMFFKPEGEMTINGVTYFDGGAYELAPGQSWNYRVDGVKTHLHSNQIFKIPGKFGFNGDVTININGQVDLDFYGFGEFYNGWRDTLPAENWLNLWNSQPYKP